MNEKSFESDKMQSTELETLQAILHELKQSGEQNRRIALINFILVIIALATSLMALFVTLKDISKTATEVITIFTIFCIGIAIFFYRSAKEIEVD